MSIRIDTASLSGSAATQAGRTDQATSTGGASSYGRTGIGTSKDSVEMSSMAESLLKAGASQDAERAQRVSQLAALYASGSYQPDSTNISRALVSHAVQAAPESGLE